jgi:hypothetical protein
MSERLRSVAWMLLLVVAVAGFFHECLFQGYSLVPTTRSGRYSSLRVSIKWNSIMRRWPFWWELSSAP